MGVGAILLVLVIVIVIFDREYGNPVSGAPVDPRTFEIILGISAILLALGAVWLWFRCNVLEITTEHVRVNEHRLFGGKRWVAPMREYCLLLHSCYERNFEKDWGDDSHTWTILLLHEHASRSVLLRSRTLLISEACLKELDGRVADTSIESVGEEFVAVSRRWARILGVALWMKEDFGKPRLVVPAS